MRRETYHTFCSISTFHFLFPEPSALLQSRAMLGDLSLRKCLAFLIRILNEEETADGKGLSHEGIDKELNASDKEPVPSEDSDGENSVDLSEH